MSKPPDTVKKKGLGYPPSVVEPCAGLTAGLLSTLVVHPLDVIKIRLQIDRTPGVNKFGTSYRLLKNIHQLEGSLYRGLAINVIGNMSSWGLFFFLYADFKKRIAAKDGSVSDVGYWFTSAAAGVTTAVITNPLWVIKTRMLSTAASTPGAYPSMMQGFKMIYKSEGLRGFMRGLVPSLVGVTHGSFQITFYEKLKDWRMRNLAEGEELTKLDTICFSASSKIGAGMVTYPAKIIQSRIQAEKGAIGPLEVCRQLYRVEGPQAFFKGLAPNTFRVLPATCITFLTYETVRNHLG
ncbi:mitochondrial carrier domain-containing protein [Pyronema omphalodes]|nr:mitochondrial carrier domain-containing protein [Pyronema omphalodes]